MYIANSMIYKNYIEMREGMDQRLLTATEKNGELDVNKKMESFVGATMHLLFFQIYLRGRWCAGSVTLSTHVYRLWSIGRLSIL